MDRLLQTELRRKSTYKKIENIHKNLKSSSTDHHNIEEQIAIEEDVLDKIFTELKSSQSPLEMAITRSVDSFKRLLKTYLFKKAYM